MTLTDDKIRGCFWGLALGDALGQPVEFNRMEVIRERYGPKGIQQPKSWAIWTDDTEMTFAITRALIRLGYVADLKERDNNNIGTVFAEELIKWFANPGYAPGETSMNAVNFLRTHSAAKWQDAGKNNSKGCGSVMRAAPVGLWFADALASELLEGKGPIHNLFIRVSTIQSEITHGHKAATAAALAGSYAVALAINGIQPDAMVKPIRQLCNAIHPDFAGAMSNLEMVLHRRNNGEIDNDIDALHAIGLGWVGDEAFAMAFYSAIRYPSDLKACLHAAANHDGDSDSVACIAGSILGALNGMKGIPADWINRLVEKKRMEQMLQKVSSFFSNTKT